MYVVYACIFHYIHYLKLIICGGKNRHSWVSLQRHSQSPPGGSQDIQVMHAPVARVINPLPASTGQPLSSPTQVQPKENEDIHPKTCSASRRSAGIQRGAIVKSWEWKNTATASNGLISPHVAIIFTHADLYIVSDSNSSQKMHSIYWPFCTCAVGNMLRTESGQLLSNNQKLFSG